jgi:hypothetical protein
LNPLSDFIPCEGLSQHHYVGDKDAQVPAAITQTFTEKFAAPLTVVPNTDHACCWKDLWRQSLAKE